MHETERIEIKPDKFADIDKNVVWLVEWLNSFEEIETLFSCEDQEYKVGVVEGIECTDHRIQVLFKCSSMNRLSWFLKFLEDFRLSLPKIMINGRELEISGVTFCRCDFHYGQCEEGEIRVNFQLRDLYVSQFQTYLAQHSPEKRSAKQKVNRAKLREELHDLVHDSLKDVPSCDLIVRIRED